MIRFETFQSNLRNKIKQYKRRADAIARHLDKRPGDWGKFQNEFNQEVNGIFQDIMIFEQEHLAAGKREKVDKLKQVLSKRLRELFAHGDYFTWTLQKPFGYAGDFWIIDAIYRNEPESHGFARLFDNYYMMSTISQAVRNRKNDFRRKLRTFFDQNPRKRLRVMNLASGACREIREMLRDDPKLGRRVTFDCYDIEQRAHAYAGTLLNGNRNVNFIVESAIRLALVHDIRARCGQQYDVIYSMGLFDYLNHKASVRLVQNLRKLLKPGGQMMIADVRDKYSNPSVHYMEWVGEWYLLYRSDKDFQQVFLDAGYKKNQLSFDYEQQGVIQYVQVGAGNPK